MSKSERQLTSTNYFQYIVTLHKQRIQFNSKSHWVKDKDINSCVECCSSFTNLNRRVINIAFCIIS